MKAKSKFYGINFPFFGLNNKPYSFSYTSNSILVRMKEYDKDLRVDVYSQGKSLIARYIQHKDDDFMFDSTCLNMNHLITSKVKWGIDSKARIYNLTNKQEFAARNVRVNKVKNNLIWADTVSYPFILRHNLVDTKLLLEQYVTIVNIDDCWYIKQFTSFHENISKVVL